MNATIATLALTLDNKIAEWAAADTTERANRTPTLIGQGFIVHCGATAYNVEGSACYPVAMSPSLTGVMMYSREDAEKVAALRGHGCTITHKNDIRSALVAEYRTLRATI